MDWAGLVRDTWKIVRRERPLWWLGLISAIQAGMFALIIVGLITPMSLLTQLLVTAQLESAAPDAASNSRLEAALPQIVMWLQQWGGALVVGMVLIVLVWGFFGVLDVAATAGAIGEASGAAQGRQTSTRRGMRDGFKIWWRTVGLLAIAALPSLVYLSAVGLFSLFTVSVPLATGQTPDLAAVRLGTTFNGLFSTVAGVMGIPLGVLVQLGLRYAVVEAREWRSALGSAWRLARENIGDIVLAYLIQFGIGSVVGFVFALVIAIVSAAGAIAVIALVYSAHTVGAIGVGAVAALVVAVLILVVSGALFVWLAVFWTLFWRRITGREPRCDSLPAPQPTMGAPAPDGVVSNEGPTNDPTSAPPAPRPD